MTKLVINGITGLLVFMACSGTVSTNTPEAKVDQQSIVNCDDSDSEIMCCFVHMPVALSNVMFIAGENEPGKKLTISGKILKADGKTPYPDVILYVYHTDNNGYYKPTGNEQGVQKKHGHLHGWCQTGEDGSYEIHTIHPAPYPKSKIPAHIHAVIKLPGKESRALYISDFHFSDDPLAKNPPPNQGKGVIVHLQERNGILFGTRDIVVE